VLVIKIYQLNDAVANLTCARKRHPCDLNIILFYFTW